jgi:hypothetical protein
VTQLNLFQTYEEPTVGESVPVVAVDVDLDEHLALMKAWLANRTEALTAQLRAIDDHVRQANPHIDEHRRSWWPHYPALVAEVDRLHGATQLVERKQGERSKSDRF